MTKNVLSRLYYIHEVKDFDFQLNNDYLFIYNRNTIKYFDLNKSFNKANLQSLGLEVDEKEEEAYIKDLKMGKDPSRIAIVLGEDEGHVIFEWNVKKNIEVLTYDVTSEFKVIWDNDGQMYILNNDGVFFTELHCNVKAFSYQKLNELKVSQKESGLGLEKGIRMDSKNHNWMILEEYLAVPFSYMSFVIKDFIEKTTRDKRVNFVFDPEPYNYLMNRSSSFLDSSFVKDDSNQL